MKDPALADETIAQIEAVDGTDGVRADEAVISRLIQVQRVFNIVSLAMVVGLAVISIFIISNTVKLAMFARREEISIQKIVGATNWFIRWPFVIEGMVLGLLAGGLAFLAEWGLYTELYNIASGVIPYFQMLAVRQRALAGARRLLRRGRAVRHRRFGDEYPQVYECLIQRHGEQRSETHYDERRKPSG